MKKFLRDHMMQRNFYLTCCHHIYSSNARQAPSMSFQGGDIVFCKIDNVLKFFEELRLTRKKIILITGEGCLPCDEFRQKFLPANVERWFATNVTHSHPRVTALPLGLDEKTSDEVLTCSYELGSREQGVEKNKWLYVNFRPETNPKIRQSIYDLFEQRAQQESWITFDVPQKKDNDHWHYFTKVQQHRFVLAPPGRGVDTHRLWESFLFGTYPIALRSPVLEPFKELPILFVDHYDEVTLELLKKSLEELEEKRKNFFMLEKEYWEQKIKEASSALELQPLLSWKKWLKESLYYAIGMLQRRVCGEKRNRERCSKNEQPIRSMQVFDSDKAEQSYLMDLNSQRRSNSDHEGSRNFIRSTCYQQYCDHTYWSNAHPRTNARFQAGDIIFCKIDKALHFFEDLRLTRKRVILVTGEGDYPCDASRQQFLPENVVRWFATNVTDPHPKVTALPLGLDGIKDPLTLNFGETKQFQNTNSIRDQWLYVNFRPETNPAVRQKIYDIFKARAREEKWITFDPPKSYNYNDEFLAQLRRHSFVLTPPGNGFDTHRLWEALALGTYPIALRSPVLEPFKELPILFVDHYDEVTLDFLKENLSQLEEKRKNNAMLQISFWEQKIKEEQSRFRNQKMLSWGQWLQESFWYGMNMIQRRIHENITSH